MAGHSKWANIKHRKAAQDAKRAKVWTKILKEITVSARSGGGDDNANPRLRTAIIAARNVNVPNDTISRAIKKGTGELEGVDYQEITYEGYGPGGVGLVLEILTDNKIRTVSEIRHLLAKHGGNLGENGSVSWNFTRTGIIHVEKEGTDEEELMMAALDAGANDITDEEDYFEVSTAPALFNDIHETLKEQFTIRHAEIEQIAGTTVELDADTAAKFIKLYELLDDHDDIQKVWANFEISDEIMAALDI
ncbi:MAG TPA: YebC/PmpR family DNA-binding transcriptional regulator [Candidatus Marinimicrobia bacterium]|nr:YebC/PmpR family DNA-binding transcriptional regulator [Candidatus Neomarinimicrobiota bacterium]